MVFYGAIRSVLDGNAPLIFDGDRFTDFLNTNFAGWLSKPLEFRPWAYPPSFLLICCRSRHWVSSAPTSRFRS
jgi:hypothetical protein